MDPLTPIGSLLNSLIQLLPKLIGWLRSPIAGEVSCLRYEERRINSNDSIVVISPWPRRYHVRLALTNRNSRVVYIKTISLAIGQQKAYQQVRVDSFIRLDSHEIQVHDLVFPLDESEQPTEGGKFQIEIAPTVGRSTTISGTFPLG